MVKLIVLAVVSLGIIILSLPSLRNPRSHGFYRFFAFESLLLLILLNIDVWYLNPFGLFQIMSWILLCSSLGLAIHGFYLLRVIGKPRENFENTTHLVVVGAYKLIRHPLYSSLLLLAWGTFLKDCSMSTILLIAITTIFLFATAKAEESENLKKFGPEYADYVNSTKMFIPYVV